MSAHDYRAALGLAAAAVVSLLGHEPTHPQLSTPVDEAAETLSPDLAEGLTTDEQASP